MKASRGNPVVWVGLLAAALVSIPARGDDSNPYLAITERNVFGLRPPPPPPEAAPVQPQAPPIPAPTIKLTGFTSLFNPPKALLEVNETAPGKTSRKPTLAAGERDGDIELVSINVAKNEVTVRNGGVLTNITFAAIESPKGPAPAAPGTAAVPGINPVKLPGQPNPGGGGPTIISRHGASEPGNSGVSVFGGSTDLGQPAPAAAAATGAAPTYDASATAAANVANRLRSIPPRPVRSDLPGGVNPGGATFTAPGNPAYNPNPNQPQQQNANPPMSREQLKLWLEANRMLNPTLPIPPTGHPADPPDQQ